MSRYTHQTKFDSFWDIAKNEIVEWTVVDDRRHKQGSITSGDIVMNFRSISARNLYDKCKNAYLKKGPNLHGLFPSKVHASTKDHQKKPMRMSTMRTLFPNMHVS